MLARPALIARAAPAVRAVAGGRRAAPRPRSARCFAARPDDEADKPWSDIVADAATVAKGALTKLGRSVSAAVGGLVAPKGDNAAPPSRPADRRGPLSGPLGGPLGGALGGGALAGPLGAVVGGLLGRALQGVGDALASQAAAAADLQATALAAAARDARVAAEFGGSVRQVPGVSSQSGATAIVNGVATKTTTIQFSVAGPNGAGVVEATDAGGAVRVRVRTPAGRVIALDGSGDGGGSVGDGGVIDVDWREV